MRWLLIQDDIVNPVIPMQDRTPPALRRNGTFQPTLHIGKAIHIRCNDSQEAFVPASYLPFDIALRPTK